MRFTGQAKKRTRKPYTGKSALLEKVILASHLLLDFILLDHQFKVFHSPLDQAYFETVDVAERLFKVEASN